MAENTVYQGRNVNHIRVTPDESGCFKTGHSLYRNRTVMVVSVR